MIGLEIKQWLILIGAMILDIFLVWFGLKLLFTQFNLSSGELFLLGCAATLAGVFVLPSNTIENAQVWGIALLFVGVYYFARSAGVFHTSWLARLLGIASLGSAVIITYIALPRNRSN